MGEDNVDAKEVIQLLRLQRHDLMNDLQIVHGYLSMGKADKVKVKVDEIIEGLNRERLLMNSSFPNFALWLIQTNLKHNHIQFTYEIGTSNRNLQAYDKVLTDIGNTIVDYILVDKFEIINGVLQLIEEDSAVKLVVTLSGPPISSERWKNRMAEKLNNVWIQAEELESSVRFTFSLSSLE